MKKKCKKILFITGTRADYGKLKSLMKIVESSENFELYIFVCGMHLIRELGSTYEEILKDNYKNIHIAHGLVHTHETSLNLGNTISHITGYVNNIEPDMIVVHGDRTDALAGAIVGALKNIRVSHIEGGEVSGTIDESIRHAVSKFAHLHFVSNQESKNRLIQLGEEEENIFVIGSPDIDIMLSSDLPSLKKVRDRYEISYDNYGIFIYHPVTTENDKLGENVKSVVDALIKSGKKYVVIHPNNDLGSEIILHEYAKLKDNKNFTFFPSMRFEYFLTLLKNSDFIVGNSSVGIRESGIYGIPAINIGTRQNGRAKNEKLKNIQFADDNVEQLVEAIEKIDNYKVKHMYFGDGNSTANFFDTLSNYSWDKTLQKRFIDINT